MSPAAGTAVIFVGDNIMYRVYFYEPEGCYWETTSEMELHEAMEFIKENWNRLKDMELLKVTPFTARVEIEI